VAIRSDFTRRDKVLETVSFLVVSERCERLSDCTAWIASMDKVRPLCNGPRLSRGPHRIVGFPAVVVWLWWGRWNGGRNGRSEDAIDEDDEDD